MADWNLGDAPIESWEVGRLIPYDNNNKKHPPEQIERLAASIKEHNFENLILVEEDGTIISGHGRRLAVLHLGWTHVPVRVAYGLPKAEARKVRIAANKTTSSEYDVDAMSFELKDLGIELVDLGSVGINDKEFSIMVEDVGDMDFGALTTDITTAVETHEKSVTEAADKAEDSETSISKALGIKKVSTGDARLLTRFMGQIEEASGLKGIEALRAHAEAVLVR